MNEYRSCLLLSNTHTVLLPLCFITVTWSISERKMSYLVHQHTLGFSGKKKFFFSSLLAVIFLLAMLSPLK